MESNSNFDRYSRQMKLSPIQGDGQQKLASSKILCIGAGGLGSPVISYLAAAGVGEIAIVDYDRVDISNLHRQVIHNEDSIGILKTASAKNYVGKLNKEVKVTIYSERLNETNALSLISKYDVVIDGSDNFATRYLVNDACVIADIPLIFGSVLQFDGQVSVFDSTSGPCYRCAFPQPPKPESVANCSTAGVLGSVCGTIGTLMATEAIKVLVGITPILIGTILLYDAILGEFNHVAIKKNADCQICSIPISMRKLQANYLDACGETGSITSFELSELLQLQSSVLLIDVRTANEYVNGSIEGSVNIPSENFLNEFLKLKLEPDSSVIIFCESGVRSKSCALNLHENGYKNVKQLEGGFSSWRNRKFLYEV